MHPLPQFKLSANEWHLAESCAHQPLQRYLVWLIALYPSPRLFMELDSLPERRNSGELVFTPDSWSVVAAQSLAVQPISIAPTGLVTSPAPNLSVATTTTTTPNPSPQKASEKPKSGKKSKAALWTPKPPAAAAAAQAKPSPPASPKVVHKAKAKAKKDKPKQSPQAKKSE